MAETDSKQRDRFSELTNHIAADTGFCRSAGPRRNTDPLRRFFPDFIERDLIVPMDFHFCAQFTEVLDEVISKGVVVVDHEEHRHECRSRFLRGQLSLLRLPSPNLSALDVTCLDLRAIEFYSQNRDLYLPLYS